MNGNLVGKYRVRAMFDAIAPTYDRLNHLLSLGVDRWWRRRLIRAVCRAAPRRVADLATGTGDVAFALLRRMKEGRIEAFDLAPGMIDRARAKARKRDPEGRIDFRVGDAEALPVEAGRYDAVTVAFGLRNFTDRDCGIAEMARIVRPGGEVAILEFAPSGRGAFAALYRCYFHRILPAVGGWLSRNREAYAYLPRSVEAFPTPDELLGRMRAAGLVDAKSTRLSFGIAYLYTANRPR